MFFFFIGGVQPRKKRIDENPKPCPSCGRSSAYLMRSDLYFSLFFIPLFPVKRGETFLECSRCGYAGPERFAEPDDPGRPARDRGGKEQEIREKHCPSCGSYVPALYRFCPHCGQRLRM